MHPNLNKYPVLSDNARIIKMSDCCVLIDRLYGSYVILEPVSAVIIAMFNGAVPLNKVYQIVHSILPQNYNTPDKLVDIALEKCKDYFYWSDEPVKQYWRYNPSDFLYKSEKRMTDKLLPLEKPLQMTLVLTNECNFKCVYCFRSAEEKWEDELSLEEIYSLIDQAAELEVKYCSLTGGEPTLHPHFGDVVIRMLERDIYPYISTNGSVISEKTLQNLYEAGLQTIQFSMDSAEPEIFNKMIGVTGYYENLINAIKSAKKLGYIVRVKGVISNLNADYIESMLSTCDSLGVDYLFFEPFSPGLDGRGNKNLLLTYDQALKVQNLIDNALKTNKNKTNVMQFKIPEKWHNSEDIVYCGGMYTSFIVQSDGTVGVCEQANHPYLRFGNIKKDKITDIWNSEAVLSFLNPDKSKIKAPCRTCEDFEKCRSGCFNYQLQYTPNLFSPDPRCWKVNLGEKDPLALSKVR